KRPTTAAPVRLSLACQLLARNIFATNPCLFVVCDAQTEFRATVPRTVGGWHTTGPSPRPVRPTDSPRQFRQKNPLLGSFLMRGRLPVYNWACSPPPCPRLRRTDGDAGRRVRHGLAQPTPGGRPGGRPAPLGALLREPGPPGPPTPLGLPAPRRR